MERDISLRTRLRPPRDPIRSYPWTTGSRRKQRAAGWLSGGSMRCHAPVAHCRRSAESSNPETPGRPPSGAERRSAAVSRGSEHAGLPQPPSQSQSGGASAVGLPVLRSRSRQTRLGPATRTSQGTRRRIMRRHRRPSGVPSLSHGRPLRSSVVGLRARLLRGRRRSHSRLRALRSRVLGEDGQVLGGDVAASRDPRLPTHVSFLLGPVVGRSRLHASHFPGSDRLIRWPNEGRSGALVSSGAAFLTAMFTQMCSVTRAILSPLVSYAAFKSK